ncbi:MAG: S8 family serine peptidase, partial [Ignavibacteria bacterium]|nr:S8 family serine peptidase [Ignavibacteria bacterium]
MNKHVASILSFAVVASMLVIGGCTKQDTTESPVAPNVQEQIKFVDNQYIVTLSDASVSGIQSASGVRSVISRLFQSYGISENNLVFVYEAAIKGFCAKLTPTDIGLISKDSRVSLVEQDQYIQLEKPIISYYNSKESQIQTQGQNWGVNYVGASISTDYSSSTRVAWIIDTGIDDDWGTADELNIQTDQCTTFVSNETWPDLNGHGTHVAGIIGAKNNSIGSVGVAPGAKVAAVKVLNYSGSGTYSQVIAGVNYVAT